MKTKTPERETSFVDALERQLVVGAHRRRGRRRMLAAVGLVACVVALVVALPVVWDLLRPSRQIEFTDTREREVSELGTRGWNPLPSSPLPGRTGAFSMIAEGQAFVWGGYAGGVGRSAKEVRSDGAAFDLGARTWRTMPEAPVGLYDTGAGAHAWTGDEWLVVGGHTDPNGEAAGGAAIAFDVDSWTWRRLPDSPVHVSDGVWTGEDFVVVGRSFEGMRADGTGPLEAWSLDPTASEWAQLADPPSGIGEGRDLALALLDGDALALTDAVALALQPNRGEPWRTLSSNSADQTAGSPVAAAWDGDDLLIVSDGGAWAPSIDASRESNWAEAPTPGGPGVEVVLQRHGRQLLAIVTDPVGAVVSMYNDDLSEVMPLPSPEIIGSEAPSVGTGDGGVMLYGGAAAIDARAALYLDINAHTGAETGTAVAGATHEADGSRIVVPKASTVPRATTEWMHNRVGSSDEFSYLDGDIVLSDADRVYVADGFSSPRLTALSSATGDVVWERDDVVAEKSVFLKALTDDTLIVSGSFEGIHALTASTGEELWSFPLPDGYNTVGATVTGGTLVVATDATMEGDTRPPLVHGLELATGNELWRTALADNTNLQWHAPPVRDGLAIISATQSWQGRPPGNTLHAISVANGDVRWERDFGGGQGFHNYPTLIGDGTVFVGMNGRVVAVDAAGGADLWQRGGAWPIALDDNGDVFAHSGKSLLRLDADNGSETLVGAVPSPVIGASFHYGQLIVSAPSGVRAVDPATGDVIWRWSPSSTRLVNVTTISGDRMAIATADRSVSSVPIP